MRDRLLDEQRRVRRVVVCVTGNVAFALLCGWAVALPSISLAVRSLLIASAMFLGGSTVILARRYRTARACRTSYQRHVDYLENHAKKAL